MGFICRNRNPCDLTTSYCRDTCSPPGYRCVKCPKYHEIRYEQYCQLKGELHLKKGITLSFIIQVIKLYGCCKGNNKTNIKIA